ncbi:PAS domain-containing hybrid sensor histidine kinase/response regulator [uncultured Roseobacter sp.]|uniref:hybrid sensor histidine kinase/response regulator n=1 Tax=uncultured Roseobacter sp. TaxID=114847 RepID=UPI0026329103|nr:PAS domain-containing hybrid sensor histidine kinase/response regulator [uncultured Roseobacter sp.]
MGVLGLAAPDLLARQALYAAATTLVVMSIVLVLIALRHRRRNADALRVLQDFTLRDGSPTLVTDSEGDVLFSNHAARRRFEKDLDQTLTGTLQTSLANPAGIVFRLKTRADLEGSASEAMVTRRGHVRLTVHQAGTDIYIWRLEDVPAGSSAHEGPALPMLLVGRTNAVLYMNEQARTLAGGRVKTLDRLFTSLPVVPGSVCEISTEDGPSRVLVAEADAGAGRRALYLLPPGTETIARDGWAVFQDLPVPLLKVSPEGDIEAYNRMAASLIGTALEEQVSLSDVMEGLGRSITDWLRETLAGRAAQQSEFLRLKRTDKEVFVQVTLNRVTEDSKPALIAVLNDATELKSLEAQFVQSQKMQAIGQLAGGVAHDFNNLLTAISGHCDLLLLRHDQGDPDFSDLVQINQNANRAAALVGQLLAFSRKQTLRPETLDMRDTLSDLTHLLNRLVGEKVTLTLSHDPVLHPIRADKRQLEQVLMNLVVNARDAMPQGGEIRVVTECTDLKEPLERDRVSVPPGEYVTVKVSDDGVGIPPDKLQKVFEPFFTTKKTGEGTGLGLSTAYGIIKQTGGYIFVDSTVGNGTCFTLYFPVLEESEIRAQPAPREVVHKPAGKHGDGVILLVEDEAPVRAFASRALRLRGYTVLEADSAESALKTLEDQSLNIDVFVTDVVMPGMDGPSWVREALKDRPGVRVVFVSGYAEDSFGEAQMKIPNSVFLPKPFSLSDLTDTVHRQLH